MNLAYKKVKANKGVGEVDEISIDKGHAYLKENWPSIKGRIRKRKHIPQPMLQIEISKLVGGVWKFVPSVW